MENNNLSSIMFSQRARQPAPQAKEQSQAPMQISHLLYLLFAITVGLVLVLASGCSSAPKNIESASLIGDAVSTGQENEQGMPGFAVQSPQQPSQPPPSQLPSTGAQQPSQNLPPRPDGSLLGQEPSAVPDDGRAQTPRGGNEQLQGILVPIDKEASEFSFVGYGIGKSHKGTFEVWEGAFTYDYDGNLIGAKGIIDATSVRTDSSRLDSHLISPDFFDANTYPTIDIQTTSITNSDGTDKVEITALLTLRGVTKEILFPATWSQDGVLRAEFLLDMSQFGITYKGVDNNVLISFSFVASKRLPPITLPPN
ncbi:MAG: YceI family protein [Candidatus Woesearchaeota archaeon]